MQAEVSESISAGVAEKVETEKNLKECESLIQEREFLINEMELSYVENKKNNKETKKIVLSAEIEVKEAQDSNCFYKITIRNRRSEERKQRSSSRN